MTSYQKLKRKVAYCEQRGGELEDIIVEMYRYMKKEGIKPLIPLVGKPIRGDTLLTDVGAGFLQNHLINKADNIYGAIYNKEQLKKLGL